MVLMISVLTLNLLTGFITDYIIHYKIDLNPYKFTAIAMLALVFILVPAFSYMKPKVEVLVARVLVSGSNSFGKNLGLLLSFAIIFIILFTIYLQQWFDINLLQVLKNKLL
jgi:type II secretory pathway component PulF